MCVRVCARASVFAVIHPAWEAHEPYYTVMLPCLDLPYCSTLSHTQHDFRQTSCWTQNVRFDILYKSVWDISHSKKNSARYDRKITQVLIKSTRCSYQILIKLDFSRQVFKKKYSNIKFHQNPCSGSRVVLCGRTDRQISRHDEEFCYSAYKWSLILRGCKIL